MQPYLKTIILSTVALVAFLLIWDAFAKSIETSLGTFPTPSSTWNAFQDLWTEYEDEKTKREEYEAGLPEKERLHNERQERRRIKSEELGREFTPREFNPPPYAGKPTYPEQIFRSLTTVFFGFFLASAIAIPLGVFCGMSKGLQTALNPIIQLLKPVSPLAWLPLVTLVVSAKLSSDASMEKSFVISAVVVALCSLWPTLINTALGVASVSEDHLNVARVLNVPTHVKVFRIILPSALPYIFAGLRISLGIGWMVLIAAEMLAQNPGLGKFVWDMFQNGSSATLGMIMAAVITIGLIGLILDRMMYLLEKVFSYERG